MRRSAILSFVAAAASLVFSPALASALGAKPTKPPTAGKPTSVGKPTTVGKL